LFAFSLMFQYAAKHNWCARNPVEEVKIPSDKDSQRIHVISAAEGEKYFGACVAIEHEYQAKAAQTKRNGSYLRAARAFRALHDLARTILLQGARPTEVMQAHVSHVDLERGRWRIPESKSTAGKQRLKLLPEISSVFAARASGCRPAGWLFAGKSPSMPMKSVERAHQKVLTRAGLGFVLCDHLRQPLGRARHGSRDHRAATRTREPAVMRYAHLVPGAPRPVDGALRRGAREAQAGPIRVQ
jgi:integrase